MNKTSNDTQTQTIVYGWDILMPIKTRGNGDKVILRVTNPLDSQGIVTRNGGGRVNAYAFWTKSELVKRITTLESANARLTAELSALRAEKAELDSGMHEFITRYEAENY